MADAVGYGSLLKDRKVGGEPRLFGSSPSDRILSEPGRSRFYRSGLDEGDRTFDIGYIGPLTTEDSSLCIAGINPAGAHGSAGYLRDNLTKMHKDNRVQRSGLILRIELDSAGRPVGASPLDQIA